MKKKALGKLSILLIVIVTINLSCKKPPTGPGAELIGLFDYNMSAAPNDVDKVGFIFAVDKNKKQIPIANLDITPTKGNIVPGNAQSDKTSSWSALANFLGIPGTKLTANAGVQDDSKVTTTIGFSKNLSISRANILDIDVPLNAKIDAIKAIVKKNKLEDMKFYLIIETIETSELDYKFGKNVTGNANLVANLDSVANISTKMKWNKNNDFQLKYSLDKPLIVFYKVFKLDAIASLTGDVDFKIDKTNEIGEGGMLYISK